MTVSTHVLDASAGRPGAGVPVRLERRTGPSWQMVEALITDSDGRVRFESDTDEGVYRLVFDTDGPFYPEVVVCFRVEDLGAHYHVPLLLSPYAYSTYRGS